MVVGEYSDLDTIHIDIGGSAAWVGHYLYDLMNRRQKSYLFSRLGDDATSKDLRNRLKKEAWIKKFYQVPATRSQCGTSFNLEKRGHQQCTTFTHRGSLTSFDWHQFISILHRKIKRGGIVYISGYFRTNLYQDLAASLETLPAKTVVFIDHGRFQELDYQRAGAALVQAFSAGLVDVYLCSHVEFFDFARINLAPLTQGSSVEETLKLCHEARILPPITVVHGEPGASNAVAYLAYNGQIRLANLGRLPPGERIGSQDAFNAGFLFELACGSQYSSIDVALDEAVVHALESWTATISKS
jgi:sugar/nucleoside kinase (ribokinase family)